MADPHSTIPANRGQSIDREGTLRLAVQLADAIVSRAYAPLIWSLYHRRFLEVLEVNCNRTRL